MRSLFLRHRMNPPASHDVTKGDISHNDATRDDYERGYDEGASSATAALFAGLLIGAGSTALALWLAALILRAMPI